MAAEPAGCSIRAELTRKFLKAASEYNRMLTAQAAALRKGDGALFDHQVEEARLAQDRARDAIFLHRKAHGC